MQNLFSSEDLGQAMLKITEDVQAALAVKEDEWVADCLGKVRYLLLEVKTKVPL